MVSFKHACGIYIYIYLYIYIYIQVQTQTQPFLKAVPGIPFLYYTLDQVKQNKTALHLKEVPQRGWYVPRQWWPRL